MPLIRMRKGEKEEAVKELQHVKYEADTLIDLIEGKGDES